MAERPEEYPENMASKDMRIGVAVVGACAAVALLIAIIVSL